LLKKPRWRCAPSSRSPTGSRLMICWSLWVRPYVTRRHRNVPCARSSAIAQRSEWCAAGESAVVSSFASRTSAAILFHPKKLAREQETISMPEPLRESVSTRSKLIWVAILYFAEGFPFGLLFDAFPVYFRTHGVSLTDIGLISLAGLPWTLKFLWAPAVDVWGKRRTWIVICQGLLALDLGLFLLLEPAQSSAELWILLIALATFSATQDIAIDAYTIELLDEDEMGPANGVRVSTYRVALICAGGVFVALAGLIGW